MEQAQATPFIRMRGISKAFGGVQALKNVDLDLYPGEVHALAGENGCGKSTLIKILSGVYEADSGTIEINGQEFKKMTPLESVRLGIQIIYQDFSIFPNLTVRENIALSAEIMTNRKLVNKKRINHIATSALEKMNLNLDPDVRVEQLSVADKQLVALTRAIHHNAKLIVMDEPTSALTYKEVLRLYDVIDGLKKEGIAVVIVSHKIDEVFHISEKYTILRNGQHITSGNVAELTRDSFTYYMTGRDLRFTKMERTIEQDTIMEVKNLSVKGAFSNISFTLNRGEMLAIVGFLGSGRTELAQSIFGITPADSGSVYIDGKETVIKGVEDAEKHGIGYIPEDRLTEGLFMRRSIMDNAIVTNIDSHTNKLGVINQKRAEEEGTTWMKAMRLNTDKYERAVSTLSGGNQQKVILARWLATEPKIFILNSPTVGVDIGAKFDLHAILRELSEQGMSIIMISDDIPEVLACSDRIMVMRDGRFIAELVTRDTDEEEINKILYTV
ncbi:sugar ABC transporter ATP-binding protein [Oscillospiraceae bacterium MB08-C2-2]|nr:sugar ABC transporter ATP-binding protein [Oscillospiraceae bacterium MB08-C2-2]